jgi:hypothetical protein
MKHLLVPFFLSILFVLLAVSCKENEKALDQTEENYIEKGQSITKNVFSVLSQKLTENIAEGGIPQALEYCNIHALNITDSLSKVENVNISRLTFNTRNPENKATGTDSIVLSDYMALASKGLDIKPRIDIISDHEAKYYAPIYINAFCLQCHGKQGEDITHDDWNVIKQNYPNDLANGYVNGDLRGMWTVTIRRN